MLLNEYLIFRLLEKFKANIKEEGVGF